MIKSKKQMFIVIGAFLLTIILGTVTYAFFNYTRTGTANTIKTGRIAFNAEQGDTVTLDGLFPITTTSTVTASTPGVGSLSIHVTGDTTYNDGIEYLVKAVNVTGSNGTELPISVKIEYTANNNKTIGTADDSYYDNRGGNSSIYKLLSTDTIEDNGDLVVGYIAPGQTGIDGNITIMAWLDASNIAITDTIEGGNIEVPGYDNGTDTDWIDNRTVFTTEEWNALTANGVSFQVRVEANEGVWVEEPIPTAVETISGLLTTTNVAGNKIYTGEDPDNYVWFNNEQWRIIGVYGDNIKIVKAAPANSSQKWQSSTSSGNTWAGSLIQTYLYDTYWETLISTAKDMIEQEAIWNVGKCSNFIAASDAYTCASSTTWTGKVGLIATYEYLYAADEASWTLTGTDYDSLNVDDWLRPSNESIWTLTSSNSSSSGALIVNKWGYVYNCSVTDGYDLLPVVYLKSTVKITGGNGQIGETNSYKLG